MSLLSNMAALVVAHVIAATRVRGVTATAVSATVDGEPVTLVTITTVGRGNSALLTSALEVAGLTHAPHATTSALSEGPGGGVTYRTVTSAWRFPAGSEPDMPVHVRRDGGVVVLTYSHSFTVQSEVRIPCGLPYLQTVRAKTTTSRSINT